jgi:hypothetical protein
MTVPGVIRIMEKNYFAAIDYRVAPVVVTGLLGTLMFGAAVIGPWTGTIAGMAAGLAPWSLALPAAVFARRLGWPVRYAVMTPLLYPVMVYAVIHSAVVTLRQDGVRWRETFYPLDILRQGTLR